MPREKIQAPSHFLYSCIIPVRITDINYGGHVGNDTVLSLIHEARVLYLASIGYSEMNMGGSGMIMRDVSIEFKTEMFYGDSVRIYVAAGEFSKAAFSLYYKLEKTGQENRLVALARTGMVCYDYSRKKIVALSEEAISRMMNH